MREDQASRTAQLVLQGLVYSATRWSTAHLVGADARDAAVRMLLQMPGGEAALRGLEGVGRIRLALQERLLLPGICLHYALRKRWLEERVRAWMHDGVTQVVNLGAGFDTLMIRLAEAFPEMSCIEVDHPATQAMKAQALAAEPAADRLALVPVDFTAQTLAEGLAPHPAFDPARRTAWVCEGVLPYLDEAEAAALFRGIGELTGPGTKVAFTFIGRSSPTGRQPYGPLLRIFLATSGESMRLRLDPEEMRRLVDTEGFDLDPVVIGPELLDAYGGQHYRGAVHDLEMVGAATFRGD